MAHFVFHWARILYGLPLAITGLIYLLAPKASVESLTSFIPGDLALIYIAGALWLLFGLLLTLNYQVRLASLGTILLLLAYLIMVHIPAAYNGEHLAVVWSELLQNVSLLGGAVFLYQWSAHFKPYHSDHHQVAHELTEF